MRRLLCLALLASACAGPGAAPSPSPSATPTASPAASPTSEPSALGIAAIQRVSAGVGYVSGLGTGVGLARTDDGGKTWTKLKLPASRITEVRFITASAGWVIGFADGPSRDVLLRTDDGGYSWSEVLAAPFAGGGEVISSLQAVDAANAWVIVGDVTCPARCGNELRVTSNGGRTWRTLYQGRLGAIRFLSPRRGWIAAYGSGGISYGPDGGNVLVTGDAGASWTATLKGQPIVSIDAFGEQVWALARDGAYCTASNCEKYELFRSADGGATWKSLGNPKNHIGAPCGGGHLAGPVFAGATRGWFGLNEGAGGVVGIGSVVATDDGGETWRCARAEAEVGLLSAADADHLWAVDTGRGAHPPQLLASDDGGASWRVIDLGSLR
jgi:photosystem II stability/assembly factor-like uncharacterized protein